MRLKLFLQSCFFCAAILLAFEHSVAAQIDVSQLLKEARQKSDENWRKLVENYPNYTYKWRKTWREADKNGKTEEKSELAEIYIPSKCKAKKCRSVAIMLEENGKAIAAEKIEKARVKAGEKLEKMESDKDAETLPLKRDYPLNWMRFAYYIRRSFEQEPEIIVKIDGQEILEKCEFFSPAREKINGREAISLKFRPLAGAVFEPQSAYMQNAEGKIWIDAEDKVFVRLLIWQKGKQFETETSEYLLGQAAAVYDMTRTAEGIWFMRVGEFRGLKNQAFFARLKNDFSIENFDFHFFKTEIKTVEINN
jgi:hypothetical protein